jgi:hypothetical protein
MITKFTPITAPTLDPRTEKKLVEYALDRIFTASGGKLNDFSPSSPARALIEGQAFAGAELLYYLNLLPEAVAIAFLQIAGIQRILGTKAVVNLTFTLTQPLGSSYVVPAGYEVLDSAGRFRFRTNRNLIITPGNISGVVAATAEKVGSGYNVAAYTLTRLTQALAYLQGCTNTEAASGGSDGESMEETKARAFQSIRRRGLVSADDYELEVKGLLGSGSVAEAMGNLAADKISFQRGTVHVFALNPDGALLNQAQLTELQSALQQKTHVAVDVFCSNIDVVPIEVRAIAAMVPGTNPQTVADAIFARLNAYLTPGKLPLGETLLIKELEHQVRLVGVEYVQSVTLGGSGQPLASTNLALPYPYSAAKLMGLTVELVDGATLHQYTYLMGDPD